MATVDERVKKIIAEQLGVEEDEVTSLKTWAPIHWIPSNSSWRWKRNLELKFRTRTRKRF